MELLKEMADAFMIVIRSGVGFRILYCLVRISSNEEEAPMYKKRIRNAVVFIIISESIWQIKDLILNYYGG